MTPHARGVALGLGASAIWSSTYVAIRLIYRHSDLDPVGLSFARFAIGGAALAAILMVQGRSRDLSAFGRDPVPFFWLGLTGVAALGLLGAIGSALTAAVNVSLIMNANPIFVVLLAPLFGERLTARHLAGVLLGLVGVTVVALGGEAAGPSFAGSRDLLGALAAAGAALSWALYTLLGKSVVQRHGGFLTSALAMLWGTLLLAIPLGASHWPHHLTAAAAGYALYLGLLPSAVAFVLWYRALELVDASVLAPTQYLAPIGTALLAWLLLGERIGTPFIIGLVLVSGGIALAARPDHHADVEEHPAG